MESILKSVGLRNPPIVTYMLGYHPKWYLKVTTLWT